MIKYSLRCERGHDFEAWFRNSAAYDAEREASALACPVCGDRTIAKAPMAPGVIRGRGELAPTEAARALKALRSAVLANAEDVGERFAEEARKIHYDEAEARLIRGRATPGEAVALIEEGVPVLPLPPAPDDLN
ncbi:MAG: DUF1178 family protein [Hyphomicrobiales bacterium]|nr:DUF1178 family protein [Hyphomicrobiales bacterium]